MPEEMSQSLQEDTTPPSPLLLECPIHGQPWRSGKFGKYHPTKSGPACSLQTVLQAQFADVCKSKSLDGKQAADWLKGAGFSGWSKMGEDEKARAIEQLKVRSETTVEEYNQDAGDPDYNQDPGEWEPGGDG